MNDGNANPSSEPPVTGTPLDYSEDLYRFYVEIAEVSGTPERVLRNFLGPRHAQHLQRLSHGFEFAAPIQCIPDLLRLLTQENIGVYQVVRRGRVEGTWR